MKTIIPLLVVLLLTSGCVSTTYHKFVSVTKDKDGNVISTTTVEGVSQPGQDGWPVKMDLLKGVQP